MRAFAMMAVAVLFSGCTFIDQKVQIQPELTVAQANIGGGRKVAVKVVDEREDAVLGKRGTGMVEGAKITTEQDMVQLFADLITQALRQKGFEPIPFEESTPTTLRAEIRAIQYDVSVGLWTGSNMAKSTLKVIAKNADKTYEKTYRGQSEIRTMWVASQETNAKIINGAVNEVLRHMFEDAELLSFLAK